MTAVDRVDRPQVPFDTPDDETGRARVALASVDDYGFPSGADGVDIDVRPAQPGTFVACYLPSAAGGHAQAGDERDQNRIGGKGIAECHSEKPAEEATGPLSKSRGCDGQDKFSGGVEVT
jgi:hypothetical protein